MQLVDQDPMGALKNRVPLNNLVSLPRPMACFFCWGVFSCKNYGRTPSRQEEDEFQEVLAAKLQSEAWKRELKFEYLEDHPS